MEHVEQTLSRIGDGSAVIGVVGLGYVGLPLVLGRSEEHTSELQSQD